jgi:hypothetical protein
MKQIAQKKPVLQIRIQDPVFFDPCIRDPDPGWEISRIGMNIPDNFSESLKTVFWIKNT